MIEQELDKEQGLEERYEVTRLGDQTGKHDECFFFVLDPKHDPIAVRVLEQYIALAKEADYRVLANDLNRKLTEIRLEEWGKK